MTKTKLHKRFNWKSRQIVNTVIDETEQSKIQVELENDKTHYDASNALVLPSAKRKTKKIRDKNAAPVKLLSKKQRIKLKKITEKKLKSSKREAILEELQKVQAKPKEMVVLTSLQTIQTMGRKKYNNITFPDIPSVTELKKYTQEEMAKLLKWKTPKAVKRELKDKDSKAKRMKKDNTVVQSESSSSDEENEVDVEEAESCSNEPTVAIQENGSDLQDNAINSQDDEDNITDKKIGKKKRKKCMTKNLKDEINIVNTDNSLPKKDKAKKKKKKLEKKKLCIDQNENKSDNISDNKNDNEDSEVKSFIEEEKNIEKTQSSNTQSKPSVSQTKIENSEEPKRTFRLVNRDPDIQKQRLKLPIISEEYAVMEAINENPVTIIIGSTGSGKTTQVPQFLYESGYTSLGMIGVTEPRRIAAMAMAERVGQELNLPPSKVSYQIRYEGNTTDETEIKFMTDGVLFQEIRNNHMLNKYSAIIIDEVHERTVHTDILLGLLSRIVPKRNQKGKPLKLIIMSATPRIEDFTQNAHLFKNFTKGDSSETVKLPVITIESSRFSVTAHFNKHTDADYCEAAYKMVCKIHNEQEDGGILVFLTGQQEITGMCERLKKTFPYQQNGRKEEEEEEGELDGLLNKVSNLKKKGNKKNKNKNVLPKIDLKNFVRKENTSKSSDVDDELPDEEIFCDEIKEGTFNENGQSNKPLWVLPLYSLLPSHKQTRVFEAPPEGTRLCVIATNVAETSLTIPNIKYVVDSGKTKQKLYDPVTGISSFHVTWTSQASAKQRAGRVGRTSAGICYRLYSSAVYNDEFPKHAIPDIQRRPLDDVVLTMKALNVPVFTFPFPSPPDPDHLGESVRRLTVLGALKQSEKLLKMKEKNGSKRMDTTVITTCGRSMSYLPVSPRFAKMILNCNQHPEIYPYLVILIAALTVREILIEIPLESNKDQEHAHDNWRAKRRKWGGQGQAHLLGDLLVLINAVLEAEENNFNYNWCYHNGLRHSALLEYKKLRRQLTNEINLFIEEAKLSISPGLKPPTGSQAFLLGEVVFLGSKDQVAMKVDHKEFPTESDRKLWKNAYRTMCSDKPVFLSSASVLYVERPKYIMYQQIYESTKVYLRGITVVSEAWMLHHGEPLVDLSPPLDNPQPRYDFDSDKVLCHRNGTYGPNKWKLIAFEVEFPLSIELFKWVAYFFLIGDFWLPLKCFNQDLYDPKILISPITLRFREKRENLIRAFSSRNITNAQTLNKIWRSEPNFLRAEYFAWFENDKQLPLINSMWPPVKKEDFMAIYDVQKIIKI